VVDGTPAGWMSSACPSSFIDAKTIARTCSIDRRDEEDDRNNGGMDRGRGVIMLLLLLIRNCGRAALEE
jgi:hypothetical protein